MGIISPAGELCQFGLRPTRALPRGQSNSSSHPQLRSFDSASRNWWRYGDYLACRRALPIWAPPHKGAPAPGSRTQVLIPSLSHLIPLRGIGGGMGIRTPDLLIANETLYQLSYTPRPLIFRLLPTPQNRKEAHLYHHKITRSYYAINKMRSKIKTMLFARNARCHYIESS
jgi:hypothetical protein